MIKFLVKLFIKNNEDTKNPIVREKYCVLAGVLGIICNLFLFIVKLIIGTIIGSIGVVSDAFNNLSDIGSSLVSIIGAKLSNMKPDKEHPFGHGRFEYISSLIVSFIIMMVGFELLKSSVEKILNPQEMNLNFGLIAILIIAVFVKFWMYLYNKKLGEQIDSGVLLATSKDSLGDAIATLAVISTTILGGYIKFYYLDGIIGTLVSIMIMWAGFQIARDTIGVLLGTPPKPETINGIKNQILAADGIVGVHDLVVHDYGPGRVMASVHAEVPDDYDIVKIHEIIDELERRIGTEMGIHMVIHMDPISVDCEITSKTKEMVIKVIKEIDERMNIHDFRMTNGEQNVNLIFDIEAPFDYKKVEKLPEIVAKKLRDINPKFNSVIHVDTIYM